MFTETDSNNTPSLAWMPSRIPVQDALVAFVPKGVEGFTPPRPVYETRWFEQPGGCRVVIPYDGGPFDASIFHIEHGAWDHVTCDSCNKRIAAKTLCYVTKHGEFRALCESCYKRTIINKLPLGRFIQWHVKRWFDPFTL